MVFYDRVNYINEAKQKLLAKSKQERLETIKKLYFLLPYEKKKIIFKDFVSIEKATW